MFNIPSFKLWESIGPLGLRIHDEIDVPEEGKEMIRNLKWEDLKWDQLGDDGKNVVWLELKSPGEISDGVIVDIQLINETLYQVHISLAEDLRGLGLGTKIYRSLVDWLGHIYSGKGRVQNPIINKVIDSLKVAEGVECITNDLGTLCISNKNPNKEQFVVMFNNA